MLPMAIRLPDGQGDRWEPHPNARPVYPKRTPSARHLAIKVRWP